MVIFLEKIVSIITPVFNAENYLKRCVGSILCQTYKNIEILLVDDGSTDNSGKICDEYAVMDDRIRVFHQNNMGQSYARNLALDNAKGDYIVFVDADDYINKDMLKTIVKVLEDADADVLIFDHYEITENGEMLFEHDIKEDKAMLDTNAIKRLIMVDKISNLIWNKIYKKSLWEKLRFPVGILFEDLYIHPQLFLQVEKAVYLPIPFYYNNRINPNSTTSKLSDFKVYNRYGKFRAYKEHERVGLLLKSNTIADWAKYKAVKEGIKAFFINYNSEKHLKENEVEEIKEYLVNNYSLETSKKEQLLKWSIINAPIICRCYSQFKYLIYKGRNKLTEFSFFRKAIVFLLVFAISNSLYNALFSISMGLSIASIFFMKNFEKEKILIKKDPILLKAYWIFFGLLIISSLLLGDRDCINKSIDYIYWSIPFWLLMYLCSDRADYKVIRGAMSISVILIGSYALYSFYLLPLGSRISGLYGNPNHFATILLLNLPFSILFLADRVITKSEGIKEPQKIILLTSCVLGISSLILSGSRGGILGIIIGGISLLLVRYFCIKKLRAGILKSFFIGVTIVFCGFWGIWSHTGAGAVRSYDMERIYLLESSYNMWEDHKILGVGLDNWRENYANKYIMDEAREKHLDMPHNVIAFFFSTTGILGGMGFIIFNIGIGIFLIKWMRIQPDNIFLQAMFWALVAINIHGLVDVGITMKSAMRLFCGLLGITVASLKWNWCKGIDVK